MKQTKLIDPKTIYQAMKAARLGLLPKIRVKNPERYLNASARRAAR